MEKAQVLGEQRNAVIHKLKHYFLLFSFVILFAGIAVFSFVGGFDHYGEEKILKQNTTRSPEDSYFKEVKFFTKTNGVPTISMRSKEMVISEDFSSTVATFVDGFYYSQTNPEPIKFSAERAIAKPKIDQLDLENKVVLVDPNHEFHSEKLKISDRGNRIFGQTQVETISKIKTEGSLEADTSTLLIRSEEMDYNSLANRVVYKGSVDGEMKRIKAYEEGIKFKTSELGLDGAKGLITLNGQVFLEKGRFEVWSNRGEIFLENYNKKLKYYSLSDDVRLREELQGRGKLVERKAFAEKLEGWMNERKVVLTGFPKVIQEKDIIKGNRIVLRENSESVEIDDANSSLILK